ncbi:MAG: hypothetical protein O7B26_03265 [Planctomycetota bacterium]|nr:hypothetical protein [Planctomycetota bacterium]
MAGSTLKAILSSSRRRWISAAWGLLLMGLLVLPSVDSSIAQYRTLGELRGKLASKAALPERARTLAERVDQKQREMADLDAALVSSEALPLLKQDVTRMARDANCRLRSIRPGSKKKRSLDEVLGIADPKTKRVGKTPDWQVFEHTLSVSIQGSFSATLGFLSRLTDDVRILRCDSLNFHQPRDASEEIVLDLTLTTIDLVHAGAG